jgi:hypothetical protein
MSVLQPLPLMCQEKKKQKKQKTKQSDQGKRHHHIGVHSLYHGIFTTFQHHNVHSYNSDKKKLIISLLTSHRLVRTPPAVSKNAEVSSWWKGSSKSNSSSFHSLMFEDVGEDGLSAQLSYIIDINGSNYIDYLAPDPALFDNEVLLGHDTLKKVYTQLISAFSLNNACIYFWSCDDIWKCPILKFEIEKVIEKSPHYVLAHKPFQ